MRILFLCTGNICRSPMAEALARKLFQERGRSDIVVASAGTSAGEGSPASEGAYLVGLEKGLDLADHAASFLTREVVKRADLILTMSPHHLDRALLLGGADKTHLLGTFAGRALEDAEVEDPFGGTLEEYRATYAQLETLIADAVERILRDERAGAGGPQP
jgi:protein-tyrosine-phosphatase